MTCGQKAAARLNENSQRPQDLNRWLMILKSLQEENGQSLVHEGRVPS